MLPCGFASLMGFVPGRFLVQGHGNEAGVPREDESVPLLLQKTLRGSPQAGCSLQPCVRVMVSLQIRPCCDHQGAWTKPVQPVRQRPGNSGISAAVFVGLCD